MGTENPRQQVRPDVLNYISIISKTEIHLTKRYDELNDKREKNKEKKSQN